MKTLLQRLGLLLFCLAVALLLLKRGRPGYPASLSEPAVAPPPTAGEPISSRTVSEPQLADRSAPTGEPVGWPSAIALRNGATAAMASASDDPAARSAADSAATNPPAPIPRKGSQTQRFPTSAAALPPEHLAALLAAADEAEIIEEFDGEAAIPTPISAPDPDSAALFELQQQVSNSTESDREQVASTLVSHFQTAPSDAAKIDLLAMAAELGRCSTSSSLLLLSLAPLESEDVRLQAVYVASDLAPELLSLYTFDFNETIREEALAHLTRRELPAAETSPESGEPAPGN